MSNIIIVRLKSGEEILGDVNLNFDDEHILITNPTQVMSGPNPQTGQIDVHMAPLLGLAAKKEVKIKKDYVAFDYEPVEDIIAKFNQLFGSGLVLPKNSGKVVVP